LHRNPVRDDGDEGGLVKFIQGMGGYIGRKYQQEQTHYDDKFEFGESMYGMLRHRLYYLEKIEVAILASKLRFDKLA
jgi:hypothetical protein